MEEEEAAVPRLHKKSADYAWAFVKPLSYLARSCLAITDFHILVCRPRNMALRAGCVLFRLAEWAPDGSIQYDVCKRHGEETETSVMKVTEKCNVGA